MYSLHKESTVYEAFHITVHYLSRHLGPFVPTLLTLLVQLAEQGLRNGRPVCLSVGLSVCPIIRLPHSAATGLLLCARRARNRSLATQLALSSKCEQRHFVS